MPQTLRDGPWRDCPRALEGETGGDSVKVQDPQRGEMSRDTCRSPRIASSVGLNHRGFKVRSSIRIVPEDRGCPRATGKRGDRRKSAPSTNHQPLFSLGPTARGDPTPGDWVVVVLDRSLAVMVQGICQGPVA